jgi:hypothetical protein
MLFYLHLINIITSKTLDEAGPIRENIQKYAKFASTIPVTAAAMKSCDTRNNVFIQFLVVISTFSFQLSYLIRFGLRSRKTSTMFCSVGE